MLGKRIDAETISIHPGQRGHIKQSLMRIGWPAEDFAGYVDGEHHEIHLVENGWKVRPIKSSLQKVFGMVDQALSYSRAGAGKTMLAQLRWHTRKQQLLFW